MSSLPQSRNATQILQSPAASPGLPPSFVISRDSSRSVSKGKGPVGASVCQPTGSQPRVSTKRSSSSQKSSSRTTRGFSAKSVKSSSANKTSAKRIPKGYCWQLFRLLVDALQYQVSEATYAVFSSVARRQDVDAYYGLDQAYGLQSMHLWQRPFAGNPATIRLLASIIRKHESMALVSPLRRKEECLSSVRMLDSSFLPARESWGVDPVFIQMRRFLREILGDKPSLDVISNSARHGPGSSLTHSYSERSSYFKYERWPYAVSPKARNMLIQVIEQDPRWLGALESSFRRRYNIEPWRLLNKELFWKAVIHDEYTWNRVTTVPKDGTKDRPIAIEPAGNIYLQLGIEGVIRSKLKNFGVNLDSQEKNRRWALLFSKEDRGATIDLSNASDTISLAFCKSILPPDWFELLDSVRSPHGVFPDGTGWRYAKMSSMGNGTTFVLESLLFYALSKSISYVYGSFTKDRVSVFGDDLEIEDYLLIHHYAYLVECGFKPNYDKSFSRGNVRESCGVDAFQGTDIRPVFLKRHPRDDMDIYNDRNRLNRWFCIHLGCSLPRSLDMFFSKYISREFLIGPESDTEFDSYWHESGFPPVEFYSYRRRTVEIPARDFDFRKLMHDLRGPSEGGKFLVQEGREVGMSLVRRFPVYSCGYTTDGVLLDQPKQSWPPQWWLGPSGSQT